MNKFIDYVDSHIVQIAYVGVLVVTVATVAINLISWG